MDPSDKTTKLIFTHIPSETKMAFDILSKKVWLTKNGWYLAGGTALALQLDHRVSFDLDFFTNEKDFDSQSIISSLLSEQWITSLREKGTLYGELKGAKVSFIAYPYFVPARPFLLYDKIHILQKEDIAVMKIIAISQRSKKRDFYDLYWYTKNHESLADVLKRVDTQFPNKQHNYHHLLKSLTYFTEADADVTPEVLFSVSWDTIKKYFVDIVPSLASEFL